MSQPGEQPSAAEIVLFGVRVTIDPLRKSVSMNNLSEYEPLNGNNKCNVLSNTSKNEINTTPEMSKVVVEESVYASADDVARPCAGTRERKRGVPWTEEEHKLFLIGLQKVGKGDWRGISRNYVKTRTPTQVASHAQKYFLRRTNLNRRRRRSSLFDITTDAVTATPEEVVKNHEMKPTQPIPSPMTPTIPGVASNVGVFPIMPLPVPVSPVVFSVSKEEVMNSSSPMLISPVTLLQIPSPSTMVDLNLRPQATFAEPPVLSLGLSISSGQDQQSNANSLGFNMVPRFRNGESAISVA